MTDREPDKTPQQKQAAAEAIVRLLREQKHTAYLAGGCVRDRIMGRPPSDYDVATDARPERVKQLFHPARLVGQAFGVVMVRFKGVWVEVATFRTEWGYSDHRHPDHVQFSDAQHDAMRRDFTINGLFYDPVDERVIDYVGGQEDIRSKIIRAIGDPDRRFEEDYLRMLRAARFSAQLGFEIEVGTAAAIRRHADRLGQISRERIGQEMQMMLARSSRATAVELLQRLGLDAPVLTEAVMDRPPRVLRALTPQADYVVAMAAWAVDRHIEAAAFGSRSGLVQALRRLKEVSLVRRWREALVLSNEQRDGLLGLLRCLPQALEWPDLTVARRKRLLADPVWPGLHGLVNAVSHSIENDRLDLEAMARQIDDLHGGDGVAPAPLLTGDGLIGAGFTPGPRFKPILDQVYDAQLEGQVRTAEQAMELARRLAEQK